MITSSILINAAPAVIWKAITEKSSMKDWYFDIPDFELKEGASFTFYEGEARKYRHHCVIKEFVINQKLVHTWAHPDHSKGNSVVTWQLNEKDGKTEVILQHDGVENFADAGPDFSPENFKLGWDGLLMMLNNFIKGIKKHRFSVEINASREKIWNSLWDSENYPRWTTVFYEGSSYEGNLAAGETILFINPEGSGMFSEIIFLNPGKYILFQHKGEVKKKEKQPLSEMSEKWAGTFESYSLTGDDGKITLLVEVDVPEGFAPYFMETFPKALQLVKTIAEA